MPTVECSLSDLRSLLGREIEEKGLEEIVLYIKGELESLNGDEVKLDIKDTNRPDLWSVEGIARELRRHLGDPAGLTKFSVEPSGIALKIDSKVEKVRPKALGAVVKDVALSDYSLKQLIQLQEKIHLTYGRNRREVAIGVYDYDKLAPPIRYTTVEPGGLKFIPLDFDEEMTPREILQRHPKGIEYGPLINRYPEYPLMIDSADNVLSIPPIINSSYTGKVTVDTENLFIELTGMEVKRLSIALNVLVAALAERGGWIQSVEVIYPKERIVTPDLSPKKFRVNTDYARRTLGLDLKEDEMTSLLAKAGYMAAKADGEILLEYPAYRNDILHERDVIEDIAIAYGLNNITPHPPRLPTIGGIDPLEDFSETLRELVVGLGYQEILTFSLTNKEALFDKMLLKKADVCEIANPVSANWSAMRNWLMPSLLEFLTYNQHVEYPQRIFEVGDVVKPDAKAETRAMNVRKLACVLSDVKAGYEDMSSALDAILSNLGVEFKLNAAEHPSFISGRTAKILLKNKNIGFIGEVNPEVLNNWGLSMPTTGFEIDVIPLFS
ncbi:MAG: phenylalanine--tRNA ligase subunit beta [Candidatus Hydrothermarchaeota archaeon]|nr:phenylalanine--tRNA ligase subunit beta [Candidatus Hydrothermarchaeota archaeon]